MNLYENKNTAKLIIVGIAFLIGLSSIFYTNSLVRKLAERETRQIELFAKAQKLLPNTTGEAQTFLLENFIEGNNSIPVILTDSQGKITANRNISFPKNASEDKRNKILEKELAKMKQEYKPIKVEIAEGWTNLIYYRNSWLITQLKYYPVVQTTAIFLLAFLAYIIFSVSRKSEQNRVWVGLAKETAHQLGTPISSLMAWIEYLKADDSIDESIAEEMNKDIKRLEMITARFSNIGSKPSMQVADVGSVVESIVSYLQKRVSSKVSFKITPRFGQDLSAMLNIPLFEWVIENLCKNAVDAMAGVGKIDIYIRNSPDNTQVIIDVNDTGKGLTPTQMKKVFKPGYTTKKRGWGLGLTLVKRIVDDYHKGQIYVRKSEVGIGTSFRINLPKGQGKGEVLTP